MYEACEYGDVTEVREILRKNPALDVNWWNQNENKYTSLHIACVNGHDPIVAILLAHPAIDVNMKSSSGNTPFLWAFYNGRTSCVRLLLLDSRVRVNEPGIIGVLTVIFAGNGLSPLWYAATNGRLEAIRWWVASGRETEMVQPEVIAAAKKEGKAEVATLLERVRGDPEKTRNEVRRELGLAGA